MSEPMVDAPPSDPLDPPSFVPFAAEPPASAARRTRAVVWIVAIAFVVGLATMALAIWGYGRWMAPKPVAVAASTAPAQQPVTTTAPVTTSSTDAIAARTQALTAQLDSIQAQIAAVTPSAQAAAGNAARAESLLVAFAARRALDRGLGLGYLELQLHARFDAIAPRAVATVLQAAHQPVTLDDLRAGLDVAGPDLVYGPRQDGWLAAFEREIASLVVIRKATTPSPRPQERFVAARALVASDRVGAALAEISRLPGAANAQDWMTKARRYLTARDALDTLEAAALAIPGTAPVNDISAPPAAAE